MAKTTTTTMMDMMMMGDSDGGGYLRLFQSTARVDRVMGKGSGGKIVMFSNSANSMFEYFYLL